MRTQAFSSPLQALYRVFVLPTLAPPTISRPLAQNTQRSTTACRNRSRPNLSRPFSTTSPHLAANRPPEKRTQLWDEEIRARTIALVDPATKSLQPPRSLRLVLASIDRKTHRVVLVSPPRTADEDPRDWIPKCRVVSKKEQYEQDKARTKQKVAAKKNSADNVKTLELNWAIDGNDLGHRMNRVREFLGQGRKVEVVLAKKKGGRKASVDECAEVVRKIVEVAEGVEGAKQLKGMEGKLGGVATLFFEGPKIQKGKEAETGKDQDAEKDKDVGKDEDVGKEKRVQTSEQENAFSDSMMV